MDDLSPLDQPVFTNPAIGPGNVAPPPPPMPQDLTPAQKFDEAVNERSPQKAMMVAAQHVGTPVGLAAIKASDLMLKGEQAFKDMTEPMEKAGGVSTPAGRIVVAQQAEKYFKQEEPHLRDAFVYWLTGDKDMARKMITGGTVTKDLVTDINGQQIFVTKNGLGDIVDARDVRGNPLTKAEFAQRYVGRQKWEDTLTFKSQAQQQETNIAELQKTASSTNAYAAVAPQWEGLYQQIHDDAAYLRERGADFSAKELADVLRFGSSALGETTNTSKSKSALDQASKNRAQNIGKTITETEAGTLKLSPKFIGGSFTAEGVVSKDGKESMSFDQMKQATSTDSSSKELTANYNQTRDQLIQSEKFKKLDAEQQNRFLRLLENSQQIGQSQLEMQAKHGSLPYIIMPSGVNIADQMGLVQGKAIQGILSARAAQQYPAYAGKILAESGGIAPAPNELLRGFTNTPEYKAMLATARDASEKALANPSQIVTAPAAQPAAGPVAPPALPARQATPTGSRPAPRLPRGIPAGSVRTNRVTSNGEPLWRAPDGTQHTEDK